jgi:hypothetical protein
MAGTALLKNSIRKEPHSEVRKNQTGCESIRLMARFLESRPLDTLHERTLTEAEIASLQAHALGWDAAIPILLFVKR